MDQTISNELLNLFNIDKISNTERIKINKLCNDLTTNTEIITELQNKITVIVENENFNLLVDMPQIIKNILVLLENVEYYKKITVESGRLKYVLYCLTITYFYNNYSQILEKIEIKDIRNIFNSVYDLVIFKPKDLKKVSCISCISSSIKILGSINKGKIFV